MPGRVLQASSTPLQDMDASAINKRASGRVRNKPDLYTSSPFTSSAKRKRDEDQEDVDPEVDVLPEDYISDEDDEEDDDAEPDEEEIREQRKRERKAKTAAPKKPAQKKPKVNGASLPIRNTTGPAKKRVPKKAKALTAADAEAAGGLYAEVFASGKELEDIAGQWLKRFDTHESSALAEVVNFVLRCAGCEGEVSEHDIEDPDNVTSKLDDLRDEYQATNPTDYPLIAKGKAATAFRHSLVSLFEALVRAMAVKGVLYDNPILMENVQMWVSTMSSAPNRSFRHTATVVSLSIVTALCEIARDNMNESSKHQRQADTERKKARANKDRVKQMEAQSKEKTRAFESIEPMLKDWFDVVFIHRYRDVDPVIRRDCVAALGDWILTVPDVFFDGQHLRYLGWVLSDTAAATRGEVLKQLHRLYKSNDAAGGLKTFTDKFRSRLVEIATTDAETSVRVSGIELLDLLRDKGLLEPDDVDAVGRMIFDSDARVRKAVANFFTENVKDTYNSKIDDLGGQEDLEGALPEVSEENYETPSTQWLRFKSLAEILQSYDQDETLPSQVERSKGDGALSLHLGGGDSRFTLATDALYNKAEEVKDWQALAGYLLFDHSGSKTNGVSNDVFSMFKHESVLTEKEEAILLEVLTASARRTLLNLADQLTQPKTKLTAKQRADIEEEQEESARHLAGLVPRLLNKFGNVPSTAAAVLRVESVLSLPSLRGLQQDTATYSALLDDVRKQFMSHGTDDVLAPATNAILHAKSYGELEELTEEKVGALWDDVIANLVELINPDGLTVRGAAPFEELTALSNNLLRIVNLARVSDCTAPLEDGAALSNQQTAESRYEGSIDYLVALVERAKLAEDTASEPEEDALEDQIAARAAEAALWYLRWKIKNIIAAVTTSSSTGVTLEELEILAGRRDVLVANLVAALDARRSSEDISRALGVSLLDVYTSAAVLRDVKRKPGMSDDYTVLIMDFSSEEQKKIMAVFAACEKHFAKLSSKNLEDAAGEQDADADAVFDDPMSDPESDDEDDEPTQTQTQASQQRRDAKMFSTLLAEQNLCAFTGKIIHALFADVMDEGAVRKRLQRNKARLGPNFKEVVAYLDLTAVQKKSAKGKSKGKSKGKAKPKANGVAKGGKAKADPKSNAIVADDEVDEDIEDADDDEALRRRGLIESEEIEEDAGDGAQAEQEAESVLGD